MAIARTTAHTRTHLRQGFFDILTENALSTAGPKCRLWVGGGSGEHFRDHSLTHASIGLSSGTTAQNRQHRINKCNPFIEAKWEKQVKFLHLNNLGICHSSTCCTVSAWCTFTCLLMHIICNTLSTIHWVLIWYFECVFRERWLLYYRAHIAEW